MLSINCFAFFTRLPPLGYVWWVKKNDSFTWMNCSSRMPKSSLVEIFTRTAKIFSRKIFFAGTSCVLDNDAISTGNHRIELRKFSYNMSRKNGKTFPFFSFIEWRKYSFPAFSLFRKSIWEIILLSRPAFRLSSIFLRFRFDLFIFFSFTFG